MFLTLLQILFTEFLMILHFEIGKKKSILWFICQSISWYYENLSTLSNFTGTEEMIQSPGNTRDKVQAL